MLDSLKTHFSDWQIEVFSGADQFVAPNWTCRKGVLYFEQLGSTRTFLKSLSVDVYDNLEELLVVTPKQTAGQGRLDRSWFAQSGAALTFNYVTDLGHGVCPGHLALLAAYSQYLVFDQYGVRGIDLKWPNDVLDSRKKGFRYFDGIASREQKAQRFLWVWE